MVKLNVLLLLEHPSWLSHAVTFHQYRWSTQSSPSVWFEAVSPVLTAWTEHDPGSTDRLSVYVMGSLSASVLSVQFRLTKRSNTEVFPSAGERSVGTVGRLPSTYVSLLKTAEPFRPVLSTGVILQFHRSPLTNSDALSCLLFVSYRVVTSGAERLLLKTSTSSMLPLK